MSANNETVQMEIENRLKGVLSLEIWHLKCKTHNINKEAK